MYTLPAERGELTAWRLHDSVVRNRLPAYTENALFLAEDDYIIKYMWTSGSLTSGFQKHTFLFGWRGRAASKLEKGSLAIQMDEVHVHTHHAHMY